MAKSRLPALFQRLTADDWSRVRAAVAQVAPGDEESVAVSVGYIDVGRSAGGLGFVGGMSMDAGGSGGLEYRKAPQMAWPAAKVAPSLARGSNVFAGVKFRSRLNSDGSVVLIPAAEADWWKFAAQDTTAKQLRRNALVERVLLEARAAGFDVESIQPR